VAAGWTVGDVAGVLEDLFPLDRTEDWDRTGLVVGSRSQPVTTVMLAVDPTEAVVADTARAKAEMLVTHHPLLLRGIHDVTDRTAKGRIVTTLVGRGCSLYTAHTNADRSDAATNDALADAAGLDPDETVPLLESGLGRVGPLMHPTTLLGLAERLAAALPPTVQGAKFSGPADARIERVALSSGAGDSLLDDVSALDPGVDCYLTSDLRHHPALEFREMHPRGPYLVDVPHFASEFLWLPALSVELRDRLPGLRVKVSTRTTDPWNGAAATTAPAARRGAHSKESS
jgi:dinuclear metal center YbgI/SA1388 family protein